MIWNFISKFAGPLVTFILIVLLISQYNKKVEYRNLAKSNPQRVELAAKIIEEYIDSSKNNHIVYKPNISTYEDLKASEDTEVYKTIDSVLNLLEISNNRISDLTRSKSILEAKMKGVQNDKIVKYEDETIKWEYNIPDTTLNISANLSLNSIDYTDGKRFLGFNLGTETLYTDMWWDDERIKINSVDRLIIKKKVPKNSIKLSAKTEYRFGSNELLIGPSTELNINKMSFEGSYMYNGLISEFQPVVSFKYNIIK